MKTLLRAALFALVCTPAMADTVLLVGNAELRRGEGVTAAAEPLGRAGFTGHWLADGDAEGLRQAVSQLAGTQEDRRLVIALTGDFVHSDSLTWFLGADADAPDLGTIPAQGIPVEILLEIAARVPGGALVLFGHDPRAEAPGPGLEAGLGQFKVPQGVAVATGRPAVISRFASDVLPLRGFTLNQLLSGQSGLTVLGSAASDEPFIQGQPVRDISPEETTFWLAMRVLDSGFAYQAYLNRYPDGAFVGEARTRLAELAGPPVDPVQAAQEAEEALDLTRSDRRAIQRDLVILGYDTRGIDGLFGPGSRGAIRAWQGASGLTVTGYLDAAQIDSLNRAAEDRREQLRAEDRAYWRATGQSGGEAGLRAYLSRYPDGEFSGLARARLDTIEAEQADRAYWRATGQGGDEADLRDYLDLYPDGEFSALARARLDEITEAREAEDRAYWRATGRNGDEAGLRAYLDRYPDGLFSDHAEHELQAYEDAREAEDRAYWRATGRNGDEAGLRAYLDRYPDGQFSDRARRELQAFEDAAEDDAAWATAQDRDTVRGYRRYLRDFPDGLYEAEARARIAVLRGEDEPEPEPEPEPEFVPPDLSTGQVLRLEVMLNQVGLNPGPVDGVYDARTDAAVRRAQEALGAEPTGIVDDAFLWALRGAILQQLFQ